jgi:hypothetical protein
MPVPSLDILNTVPRTFQYKVIGKLRTVINCTFLNSSSKT